MLRKKTAAYALLAIYEIAEQQRGASSPLGVRAGDVADKHHLPKAYVAKILSQLANAGVLRSDRGPRGGFRLNKPMEAITLFDVFDGVGALMSDPSKPSSVKGLPPAVQTTLDRSQAEVSDAVRAVLRKTSIMDVLLGSQGNPGSRSANPVVAHV
ncbi:HTH-type transcriptional regulator CymR [Phycisphaerae bacterium RAS2]|nr:HTH-type transcriptional regulator CymR [Phycisphaerae bacterium RAS2]